MELNDLTDVGHVDEGLAHVGLAVLVDRHVEEVIASKKAFIDVVQQYTLAQPVGDVANHQGGAAVLVVIQIFDVYITT